MSRPVLRWAACGLAAGLMASTTASSFGQEKKGPPKVTDVNVKPSSQRASGVIIKSEPIAGGGVRMTINTAVVWRDWVRDQAQTSPNASPRKAAERGANSVATKGEPQTRDDLVVVKLGRESKVETRFRTPADETSKGSSTPAAAREASAGPKDTSGTVRTQTAKPPQFKASDLKPGLFVEADFRRAGDDNVVSSVTVIRPVSEPAATPKPAGK